MDPKRPSKNICVKDHLIQPYLHWLFNVKIDQRTIPMTLSLKYDGIINKSHVTTIELHIGVAPITQLVHVRNKNSNTQGSSCNVLKVIFKP